ncbi:MAG: hypothetical protein AAGI08_18700, partial [Bacteroidota bacterium]
AGVHYLDITGEVGVFERLSYMDEVAKAAGIMVMPGVGFDVVPTDCIARHLADQLPDATHLDLAIWGLGQVSHGTATTMVENIGEGGAVRRDGRLKQVPSAYLTKHINFGPATRQCVSIPWGDLATAYRSTGIPNITTYAAFPLKVQRMMKLSRTFGKLLASKPAQAFLKRRIQARPAGPDAAQRAEGRTYVFGEAWNDAGQRVSARLAGPEGYTFTAKAALVVAERVLAGQFTAGYQTPAGAYGADLVLDVEGVSRDS